MYVYLWIRIYILHTDHQLLSLDYSYTQVCDKSWIIFKCIIEKQKGIGYKLNKVTNKCIILNFNNINLFFFSYFTYIPLVGYLSSFDSCFNNNSNIIR